LEIPVVDMSQLANGQAGFLRVFRYHDQDSFSALTLFTGTTRLIVHNDSHHPHRQSSNIAHEISHCLLEHPPGPLVSAEGCRYWDPQLEAEAEWLGAALLVPRDGGLRLAKRGWDIGTIADHYNVSETLCRWRLQQTGVLKQIERLGRRSAPRF
jgi:Zn-dependent peptidase ImmA (M78 family)